MSTLFDSYSFGVLDASLFRISELTSDLREALRQTTLYAAGGTFVAEVMEYESMLSGERLRLYHRTVDFISQENAPFEDAQISAEKPLYDTWELIRWFEKRSDRPRFVVVTGNELLIDRMILENVQADIFDIRTLHFYDCRQYPHYWVKTELQNPLARRRGKTPRITKNATLFRSDGSRFSLGREIGSGLESWLYLQDGRPDKIVKIFRELTPDKRKNIRNLLNFPERKEIPWALFPEDFVYYDGTQQKPAGILEPYAPGERNIGNDPLYAGDLSELSQEDLNRRLSETILLCLKITRQICFLGNYGFFISDFNPYNFALRFDSSDPVLMFDTDSFGYKTYFGGNQANLTTTRVYDKRKKVAAIDFCHEMLYAFLFTLLSLGDMAIDENDRSFRYDLPEYQGRKRRKLFPDRIWEHMAEVFRKRERASPEKLIRLFSEESARLSRHPEEDVTYQTLCDRMIGYHTEQDDQNDREVSAMSSQPNMPESSEMRRISIGWDSRHDGILNSSKRLPIVFCLDVSPSMNYSENGNPSSMDLLNASVRDFVTTLGKNPKARAAARIAFVPFSTDVIEAEERDFQSITEIERDRKEFHAVEDGGTRLANAVLRSMRKIEVYTTKLSNSRINYYMPFLVIVTDGNPQNSDNPLKIRHALGKLRAHNQSGRVSDMIVPVVIGVGDQANLRALRDYAEGFMDGPFWIRGDAESAQAAFTKLFQALIKSVTDSLKTQSLDAIRSAMEEAASLMVTDEDWTPSLVKSEVWGTEDDMDSAQDFIANLWTPDAKTDPSENVPQILRASPDAETDPSENVPQILRASPDAETDPSENVPQILRASPDTETDLSENVPQTPDAFPDTATNELPSIKRSDLFPERGQDRNQTTRNHWADTYSPLDFLNSVMVSDMDTPLS